MRTSSLRLPALAVIGLLAVSACGSSSDNKVAGAKQVSVKLTDAACDVDTTTVPAGPVTFTITGGSASVTEAELVQGERILGEKENIAEGLSGDFTLSLKAGTYAVRCPGGSGSKDVAFTVTGDASATTPLTDQESAAVTGYEVYVKDQVAQQVAATKALTDAVRKGDLVAAAAAYPAARVNYERIEPVAESFGDIDPDIDARIADVPSIAKWTGYHRLEHAIFKDRSLAGMVPIANGLDADVTKLHALVATTTYTVAEIANGASELLAEVAKSKITGEEENYSHIDLLDFQANIDGARTAFTLLQPALAGKDATLATQIAAAFDAVDAALRPYRTGKTALDFKPYSAVTPAAQKSLAGVVDALAEPLSQVAAKLVTT